MEPNIDKKGNGMAWISSFLLMIVVVAAGFGIMKYIKGDASVDDGHMTNGTGNVPTTPADTGVQTSTSQKYKDGSYTAVGDYNSPGGAEQIGITLVLKNDVIVDATASPKATRPQSVNFQQQFSAGFKVMIVGKNIDEVSLDKVSGSSLTPKGFNDAIAKIKVQAKA